MHFRAFLFASAAAVIPATAASSVNPLISVVFDGNPSAIQRQTFLDAADYWNSVVTGYDLIYDAAGAETPHALVITASVVAIDGAGTPQSGNVLGSANWTQASYYDNDPLTPNPTLALYYATEGYMQFDEYDVGQLVGDGSFYGVVLHEMAHVMGIGTLWTLNSNVNGTTYPLYTTGSGEYTGPNALREWRREFLQPGDSFVPVELGGNAGNADGHWNEIDGGLGLTGFISTDTGLDFAYELMTGWASNPFFVSAVTLGSLDDLGYDIDYSKTGLVTHVVVVPEPAVLTLTALTALIFLRRRRDSPL